MFCRLSGFSRFLGFLGFQFRFSGCFFWGFLVHLGSLGFIGYLGLLSGYLDFSTVLYGPLSIDI